MGGFDVNGRGTPSSGRGLPVGLTSTMTIVDDVEDGDISEYSSGNFLASSNNPIEGTYSIAPDTGAGSRIMWSGSGLDNYPARGDTYSVLGQEDSNAQNLPEFLCYGEVGDGNFDGYGMGFFPSINEMRIRRYDNNNPIHLTSTSVSFQTNTVYECVMESTSSDLTFTIYEVDGSLARGSQVDSISTSDSTHSGTAVGIRNGTSADGTSDGCLDRMQIL